MKRCVIGIAAHVDAGKTTLAESLLYTAGMIRRKGRGDNGTAFLDTEQVEKERGITVFSHQAVLETESSLFTLLDTPGHEDFSAQTEQAVSVMDTAILVISGTDGIQSHSLPLWRIMERHRLPVVIFVNKIDISAKSREELLSELHTLSDRVCPFDDMEGIAGTDEALMNEYLESGELSDESLAKAFGERAFFPCVFGSALKGEGADELLRLLDTLAPEPRPKDTLSGRVFKVTYDGNTRLTHLRLTGGTLSPRDFIGEEKINALRIYSGSRYTTADRIYPGMTAAAAGLTSLRPGDVFGDESTTFTPVFEPVMTYRVIPPEGMDEFAVQTVMQRLEEEEPLLGVQADSTGVHVKVMGEVQLEIISRRFSELTGKTPSFDSGTVAFLETIAAPADGAGHFEPLRHYGEVHVHMEPLPRGSGITIDSKVSEDVLQGVWQNSILSALSEKRHKGVLTGAPLTDVHITLTAGKDVLWITGCRIPCNTADHTSDHVFRVDFMSDPDCLCGSDKLIMQMLVGILICLVRQACGHTQELDGVVDLIECQPMMNQSLVFREACLSEPDIMVDGLSVKPSAAMFFQIERCIEMPDSNQRFNAVLMHFFKHVTIEFHPCL